MEATKTTHLPTLAKTLGQAARRSKVAVERALHAIEHKTGLELKTELAQVQNELADQFNQIVDALSREKELQDPPAPTPAAASSEVPAAETGTTSATSPVATEGEPKESALAADATEDNQQ